MMYLAILADIALFPYEPPWMTALVLLLFLLFMGGCIGSFLNVVIYRLPAGLSIVKPRSRCPRCLTPILARDNLPVIGWLLLRGRCRFCKTRIPARYPLVEAAAGLAFAALCVGEAIYPGATLPISRSVALENYPFFGSAMYHFALVCGLGAAGMMAHDQAVVPVGYWRVVLLVGLLPPLFLPSLRPIAGLSLAPGYGPFALGLLDGCLGALVGALLGAASWPASTLAARARSGHLNAVAALASVGAFLGWQAAAGISLATALLVALRAVASQVGLRFGSTWPLVPAVITFVWLMFWRPIVGLAVVGKSAIFGPQSPAWFAAAAVSMTFVLSLAVRRWSLVSSPNVGSSQQVSRATPLN